MVFWASVLVFLASIMIYVLLPVRVDDISVKMYQDDPYIISFLAQHQAAKDFTEQMISAKTTSEKKVQILNPTQLRAFLTYPIKPLCEDNSCEKEIYYDEIEENGEGTYTSAIVCLGNSSTPTELSVVPCPSNEQYVITYGNVPTWWRNNASKQKVWLTSLRKKSHGSEVCGSLEVIPGSSGLYGINNGQRFGGFKTAASKQRYIPEPLANYINENLVSNTPNIVCVTPFKNPYINATSPIFHWESANNDPSNMLHNYVGIGSPLIGVLSEIQGSTYTISGVFSDVSKPTDSKDATISLVSKGSTPSTLIQLNCSSGGLCTLTAGSLSQGNIPQGKPFAFTYMNSTNQQKLMVSWTHKTTTAGKNTYSLATERQETTSTGPSLENISFIGLDNSHVRGLSSLRIYDHILSDSEIAKNNKVDKKRFGL